MNSTEGHIWLEININSMDWGQDNRVGTAPMISGQRPNMGIYLSRNLKPIIINPPINLFIEYLLSVQMSIGVGLAAVWVLIRDLSVHRSDKQ
jgi:hypothetical protein